MIDHPNITRAEAASNIVLVCEHASAFIPECFNGLGLTEEARLSHAAWDPGALRVNELVAEQLDAVLVAGGVSRLVYDCNRPPYAPDAMPVKSERFEIPGNRDLTAEQRADRVDSYYEPFRAGLAEVIARKIAPIVVTIHSFTPVYHGKHRAVEIGILHAHAHANDTRFADAMLAVSDQFTDRLVLRNEPYGPEDGVVHTLLEQAERFGHPNVMIEIRNDLISDAQGQEEFADLLAPWLRTAIARLTML